VKKRERIQTQFDGSVYSAETIRKILQEDHNAAITTLDMGMQSRDRMIETLTTKQAWGESPQPDSFEFE
jgi:hypothetical protein